MRRFGVWNGTSIHPAYGSLGDVEQALRRLVPPGRQWTLEYYPKAGEGGSWQSTWDSHPLALDGFGKLLGMREEMAGYGVNLVPYVVLRGRPEWRDAEFQQIAEIAVACRRVILNLEPGSAYWNGPTTAEQLTAEYTDPMWARIRDAFGGDPEWKKVTLQLGMVPRQWCIDALGGDDNDRNLLSTLEAWARAVRGISWETYDGAAADLCVADSLARVDYWLADTPQARRRAYKIPIVQRSRINVWAGSSFADYGLEVWHLDGDL